jgi:flagellar hook protein FlgE
MSLFGVMRTGVSGMGAQSNKLATVADNIANTSTTGYKRASTEFSSMILASGTDKYESGGVTTSVRYAVNEHGALSHTSSVTDLAISGNGFLIVTDANGAAFLTRAGSFVPDGSGDLINAAGFRLMGIPYSGSGDASAVANGLSGLSVVNIKQTALQATPSTLGSFFANLPSFASTVAAADLPSANAATASYTAKSSLVAYDHLGAETILDIYLTKTANDTWEIAVFNQADVPAGGGFPYANPALAVETLTFDPATGALAGASANAIDVPIPNGETLTLDLSGMTQLSAGFSILDAVVNGNSASEIERIEIDTEGTLYAIFQNGARLATYKIPLADVPSPNNLTTLPGNVYQTNPASGAVQVGFSTTGGLGTLVSGALESSTVDLATELTAMIEAQRGYTANSKVFQTGAELLDVLVNLKR